MRITLALAVAFLGVISLATASDSDAGIKRYELNIPRQSLDTALKDLAAQTGLQIARFSDAVRGDAQVGPLSGNLTADQALKSLLEPNGLTYRPLNERGYIVLTPEELRRQTREAQTHVNGAGHEISSIPSIRVAQNEEQNTAMQRVEDPNDERSSSPNENEMPPSPGTMENLGWDRGIPEILVRGSRSLNADIGHGRDDSRPYVVISRETIEKSSARNVGDLLAKTLTMSYALNSNDRRANPGLGVGNFSQVQLRGLSNAETLILIDGRRTTMLKSQFTELQSDINTIPLSQIERIEVLPSSASSIYGGNATGGVINVVLRRDYTGIESRISFADQFSHGGAQREVSLQGGTALNNNRTSVTFGASYSDRDPLLFRDQEYIQSNIVSLANDQMSRIPQTYFNLGAPPLGSSVNISSVAVGVAPILQFKPAYGGSSLGSSITSLPKGYRGVQSDGIAALVTNAGRYNLELADSDQNGGDHFGISSGPKVGSLNLALRQDLPKSIEIFFDVSASRSENDFPGSLLSNTFTVPSSSPVNPFQQDIVVTVPMNYRGDETKTRADQGRALLGAKILLPRQWSLAFDASFSAAKVTRQQPSTQFLNALDTAISQGTVNLLQDRTGYSDLLESYVVDADEISPSRSQATDMALRTGGSILAVPGGDIMMTAVLENLEQRYGSWTQALHFANTGAVGGFVRVTDGEIRSSSIYTEFLIPLISDLNSIRGVKLAEFQAAGRYDRYHQRASYQISSTIVGPPASRVFESADPSISLRFKPINDLTVRTSYGLGFRPPYLNQLQERLPIVSNSRILDPKRGNQLVIRPTVSSGGNPDLRPEKSVTLAAGIIVQPTAFPNLRVSIDWTRINKTDNIQTINYSQTAVNNEDRLPGLIGRAAPAPGDPFGVGPIVRFDSRPHNAAHAVSESFDLAASYALVTNRVGKFSFDLVGTKLTKNSQQLTVLVPYVDLAGTIQYPKWNANASIGWDFKGFNLEGRARYLDSFWLLSSHAVEPFQGSSYLPSETYFDLSLGYSISNRAGAIGSILSGSNFQLAIQNIFNTQPRRYAQGNGLPDPWVDPATASYFISWRKSIL